MFKLDKNLMATVERHIDKTIAALKKNNMEATYAKNRGEALELIKKYIKDGETITTGGSMTLEEIGAMDIFRSGKYNFLDRYKEGITRAELDKIFRDAFSADAYFTSSNAVTEEGELYNVDCNGNRVSAMIFGPKSVVVVAGYNKIVADREAAVNRVRTVAAPANAVRLGCKTPCVNTGSCFDCKTEAGICCSYVFLGRQHTSGRIKVIIVGERLGY